MPNRPKKKKKNMSEEEVQEQAPDLNVGDMNAVLRIIDVVTERGAFKGEELSSIGNVRDRVAAFVNYHTPKSQEGETKETSDEAATEGAEVTEESSE
jgi:hypothetical protein